MATTNNTSHITQEQIARCTRVIDQETMEAFYLVLSESDNLTQYKVQYVKLPSRAHKGYFTCTCPAGLEGFAHVHHSSGVCKHVRWALAAADLYKEEIKVRARRDAAQAREHLLTINGKIATDEEYARVMNAKPFKWSEDEIKRDMALSAYREFRLLR